MLSLSVSSEVVAWNLRNAASGVQDVICFLKYPPRNAFSRRLGRAVRSPSVAFGAGTAWHQPWWSWPWAAGPSPCLWLPSAFAGGLPCSPVPGREGLVDEIRGHRGKVGVFSGREMAAPATTAGKQLLAFRELTCVAVAEQRTSSQPGELCVGWGGNESSNYKKTRKENSN